MIPRTQPLYTETFKTIFRQELSIEKLFIEKLPKNKQRTLQLLKASVIFAAFLMPVVSIIGFFPALKATRDLIAASTLFCGMPLLFIFAFIYTGFQELNICLVMRRMQRKYNVALPHINRLQPPKRNAYTFLKRIFSSLYLYTAADMLHIRIIRFSEVTIERNFDAGGDWCQLTIKDIENEINSLDISGTSNTNAVVFWNVLFTFALNLGNHKLISIAGIISLAVIKLCMHFHHNNEKRKVNRIKKELRRMQAFLNNYQKWRSTMPAH